MHSYNSMIFVTYSSTAYQTLQVSSGFVDSPSGRFAYEPYPLGNFSKPGFTGEVQRMRTLLEQNALEHLSPIDCINAYNVKYQSTYGSVLLVSDNESPVVHNTCVDWDCNPTFNSGWMCDIDSSAVPYDPQDRYQTLTVSYDPKSTDSSRCLLLAKELRNNASNWTPNFRGGLDNTLKTAYCLAERVDDECSVQSNPYVAIIILGLNLAKAIAMLVTSQKVTGRSLVTIGDGISSFLETPDQYTRGMCLASYRDFKRMHRKWNLVPKTYAPTRVWGFSAAGKKRWIGCIALYVLCVLLCQIHFELTENQIHLQSRICFLRNARLVNLALARCYSVRPRHIQWRRRELVCRR